MPAIRKINRISSKYSALERRNNRCLKICLTNIFAPQIQLERISNAKIQFIQQFGVEHYLNVSAIYLDHCYLHEKHCPYEQHYETHANQMAVRANFINRNGIATTKKQINDYSDYSDDSDDSDEIINRMTDSDEFDEREDGYSDEYFFRPYEMDEFDNLSDNEMSKANDLNGNYNVLSRINSAGYSTGGESSDTDDEIERTLRELNQAESDNENNIQRNCDENNRTWPSIRLFDNICLKHLLGKCYNYDLACPFLHQMPHFERIFHNLELADRCEIEEAHKNLLTVYEPLLIAFWSTFCRFYGRKNYREYLRLSIGPISMLNCEYVDQLLMDILNGFMITGIAYQTAVQIILNHLDETLQKDDQFKVVWNILLDARNDGIQDMMQTTKFTEVMIQFDGAEVTAAMNKMLDIQLETNGIDIRGLISNILKRSTVPTFMAIDGKLLKDYIWHLNMSNDKTADLISQRVNQCRRSLLTDGK